MVCPGSAADTAYTYEADGDLSTLSHAFVAGTGPGAVAFSYGHDGAGKITTVASTQPVFEWMPALTYARSYGTANVLNQVASEGGVAIAFNTDANMTSDGVTTYSWTFGNRMSGASRSGMTATYAYDSDDRRTKKTVNGVVTRTLWAGSDELAEYDVNGDPGPRADHDRSSGHGVGAVAGLCAQPRSKAGGGQRVRGTSAFRRPPTSKIISVHC